MDTPQVTAGAAGVVLGAARRGAGAERGRRVLGDRPAGRSIRRRCSPASRCPPTGPAPPSWPGSVDLGLSVELLPPLRDVDDAGRRRRTSADRFPDLRFSQRHRQLTAAGSGAAGRAALRPALRRRQTWRARRAGAGSRRGERLVDGSTRRWTRSADPVDEMVVLALRAAGGRHRLRAGPDGRGPAAVGPGRPRHRHLGGRRSTLGSRRGGQLLRRGYADPLPGGGSVGNRAAARRQHRHRR